MVFLATCHEQSCGWVKSGDKLLSMKPETKYDKMDPRRGRGRLTIKLVASQKNPTARASMWVVILKTSVHTEVQVLLY